MWRRYLFAVFGFWGGLFFLKVAFNYLAPFLIGLVLALLLDAPISFGEKRGVPRPVAAFLLVLAAFLGLPLLFSFFLVQLWSEIKTLSGIATLRQLSDALLKALPALDFQVSATKLMDLGDLLWRWATAIPGLCLIWLLAAISAYFFCRDKRAFTKFVLNNLPKTWRKRFFPLYFTTHGALFHLIWVQLALMAASSCLTIILFCLLKIPYALLWGLAVGFLDLIPILGPGIIYLVLFAYYLWLGEIWIALALGLAYVVFLLLRQWGEPHLMSRRLGLHPVVALMALYFGFKFWGFWGAFLGPLLMVFFHGVLTTCWTS